MTQADSHNRLAPRPLPGSLWVWEPTKPYAAALVQVVASTWNGEEWWVTTCSPHEYNFPPSIRRPTAAWNELSRFWEACHAVAAQPGARGNVKVRRGEPVSEETTGDPIPAG